ncbi:hypothetical protein P153DRAFT_382110 [Dothidotthia symphoricarpi CBS 119687]|uniref:Uncharacterized protein n=1 Tax=Dothidotthia symphoricarpi CBS 119687 TaxID=1392245 RepID=A0A6A6ALQ6_9PLEO|nr:uncharacterized protein P153DRAFT_382110 [Dothidotthia symphoricarpi CBS 119687]KAF2132486.1 hypothetical protein P153DRAFT_382110 [Dothidotthia symphoricarpi CBS 119687]
MYQHDALRQDLLYRLRWNVFGPLRDIKVVEKPSGDSEGGTLSPLQDHPIASEFVGVPPCAQIRLEITECITKHNFDYTSELGSDDDEEEEDEKDSDEDEGDVEQGYQPPPPLIIRNSDDTPITIEQFFKDEIYSGPENNNDGPWLTDLGPRKETGNIPEGTDIYLQSATGHMYEDGLWVQVSLLVDGDYGLTKEALWSFQAKAYIPSLPPTHVPHSTEPNPLNPSV